MQVQDSDNTKLEVHGLFKKKVKVTRQGERCFGPTVDARK